MVRILRRLKTFFQLALCVLSLVIILWFPEHQRQNTARTSPTLKPNLSNLDSENYAPNGENFERGQTVSINTWLEQVRKADQKPNVFLIIADDLRPDIGAYSGIKDVPWIQQGMVTPHLDALAARSMVFRRAYCQQSWCNPSRASFLTSRRPDTTMVHNNSVFFRQNNPEFVTLPQYFKENGYLTLGGGKIFHSVNKGVGARDNRRSWSVPVFRNHPTLPELDLPWWAVPKEKLVGKKLLDDTLGDYISITLEKLASTETRQPFFLAMGIKKPHLKFIFPEHFQDLYPLKQVSMPRNPRFSKTAPDIAWFNSNEIINEKWRDFLAVNNSAWDRNSSLPSYTIRYLRRAYYSCVSYIDDLIGAALNKLDNLGLSNNTIIAFIGDHGFHLGEHGIIGKNTNFEVANRSPLMISVPGVTEHGMATDKMVELVDLFPSLVDLAGLPSLQRCPPRTSRSRSVNLCTEGSSLVALMDTHADVQWKDRVFFQYPHHRSISNDSFCMGYSMRTLKYRYTEWVTYHYTDQQGANWDKPCAVELYNHDSDPDEAFNLAEDIDYKEVISNLSQQLRAGWTAALPQ